MALTDDGRLFGWGWNAHGQCGLGDSTTHIALPRAIGRFTARTVVSVACGAAHTVALVQDDPTTPKAPCSLYAWGARAAGQLGHAPGAKGVDCNGPCVVETLNGLAGPPIQGGGGGGAIDSKGGAISQPLGCGACHTALVTSDGALWTWGGNQHGQCGQQRLGVRVAPGPVHALAAQGTVLGVSCGGAHTLVIVSPGKVFSFGLNSTGQLGDGQSSTTASPMPQPVRMGSGAVVTRVTCGEEFSTALTRDGQLLTWGYGGTGQLGHGNFGSMRLPRPVPTEALAGVACGMGHVLAQTRGGGLLAWGYQGSLEHMGAGPGSRRASQASVGRESELSADAPRDASPTAKAAAAAVAAANAAASVPSATARCGAAGRMRAEPETLPRSVNLDAAESRVLDGFAPGVVRSVAAGRFFGVFIGEPVQPIAENDAAVSRNRRAAPTPPSSSALAPAPTHTTPPPSPRAAPHSIVLPQGGRAPPHRRAKALQPGRHQDRARLLRVPRAPRAREHARPGPGAGARGGGDAAAGAPAEASAAEEVSPSSAQADGGREARWRAKLCRAQAAAQQARWRRVRAGQEGGFGPRGRGVAVV